MNDHKLLKCKRSTRVSNQLSINKIFPDSKRSQSNLVIIVLIVLICIIAIILLWNFFYPFIKEKSKDINVETFRNEFAIKEVSLFITGALRVDVQRMSGNLSTDSLKFVFEDENGKTNIEIIKDSIPLLLETNKYYFSPISNFGKLKKITVYPVFDGKEGMGSSIESRDIFNIPTGLISWWKFEGNLEDSVGKNDGITDGNIQFADDGKKSVNFVSGFINLGNDSSLELNKEFAISFFIKTNSKNSEVLSKGGSFPNYLVNIDSDGKINFSYFSNGEFNNKKMQNNISDGKWHNIIITNMAAYLDGELDNILNINSDLDINSENLILGKRFVGYISDLMIFNRSLDMNQAKNIYNSLK